MRLTRTLFCLLPILCACGGVEIVLKSPVESQCGKQGLKGCPELTEGVMLYVKGDKPHGKDKLLRGSAQNAPDQVRKFAQTLRELEKIPGTAAYMTQVHEIIDILSGGGGPAPAGPGPAVVASGGGAGEGGTVTIATAQKMSCGSVVGYGACAWVVSGPITITNLSVDPGCSAPMSAGAANSGLALTTPRWVTQNPRGLAASQQQVIAAGESLFIGLHAAGLNDPRCQITWTGHR